MPHQRSRLPIETRQQIAALTRKGKKISEIVRLLCVTATEVNSVRKNMAAHGGKYVPAHDTKVWEKIRKLHASGVSKNEIAKRLKVGWGTISKALGELEVQPIPDAKPTLCPRCRWLWREAHKLLCEDCEEHEERVRVTARRINSTRSAESLAPLEERICRVRRN